jgi:branched-chain amino acid aminotransferase
VVPVRSIDGRTIGDALRGPMVARLQALYRGLVERDVAYRAGVRLA